ncbi:lipase family alpha/beta hydrolase [Halocatena pleomorpha]|uniref:DUF7379 domain-containing protein n=1 Tax=Halocatena pleomorpha TaxID=1785090 RepID=A0A3P3R5V3_9EURY|nr:hypothetical protein [Halocatena pleomorpha]RRJ28020.1 hypothetical protein EIK79_16685 [Halocatena pleomorpha]
MTHQQVSRTITRRGFLAGLGAASVTAAGITGIGSAAPASDRSPVLMVHGFLDSRRTPWWDITTHRLQEIGYTDDELYLLRLGALGTTVDSPTVYAEEVTAKLQSMSTDHGSDVDIIAHSMGGLDSRWAIEKMGADQYVDSLITLGTPHQGTYVAYLAYITPGGRDMIPGSDFLRELNDGQLAESVDYTALWSNFDELITPDEYAMLPSPECESVSSARNVFIPYKGHIQLALDEAVFEAYAPSLG